MSSDDARAGGGPSLISGLLAPLRLPDRAVGAVVDLASDVAAISSELTRIREQTAPLTEMLSTLERVEEGLRVQLETVAETIGRLESDESHLNRSVVQLGSELAEMHETLSRLRDSVERITERLPNADEKRGPLKAARDVLTGGGESKDPPASGGAPAGETATPGDGQKR